MELPQLKVIHQNSIVIPENRIRKDFSPERLEELAISIAGSKRLGVEAKGLLHPIVLAFSEELDYELIAGERRLRTMMLLHKQGKTFMCDGQVVLKDHIPFTLLGELSPDARKEAELEENTVRTDLTWQELHVARADLHKLRVKQHGEVTMVSRKEREGWSLSDTAKEVGLSRESSSGKIRDALVLAEHMDDEDVANAKTAKEALKILKNKHIKFLTEELAKRFGNKEASLEVDFRNEDLQEAIITLPDESFDCIITDPPYGIAADNFGGQSIKGHHYDDSSELFTEIMQLFFTESYRIAKRKAHLYLFCDWTQFSFLSKGFAEEGWSVWPRPIIWNKGTGMLPVPEYGPRYTHEYILYANKGKRPVTAIFPDVISIPALDGKVAVHAAQKPVELYEDLINRCCAAGDTIFDGFAGSGTIFFAAKRTKTIATGIEKDFDTYNAALVSIQE